MLRLVPLVLPPVGLPPLVLLVIVGLDELPSVVLLHLLAQYTLPLLLLLLVLLLLMALHFPPQIRPLLALQFPPIPPLLALPIPPLVLNSSSHFQITHSAWA